MYQNSVGASQAPTQQRRRLADKSCAAAHNFTRAARAAGGASPKPPSPGPYSGVLTRFTKRPTASDSGAARLVAHHCRTRSHPCSLPSRANRDRNTQTLHARPEDVLRILTHLLEIYGIKIVKIRLSKTHQCNNNKKTKKLLPLKLFRVTD